MYDGLKIVCAIPSFNCEQQIVATLSKTLQVADLFDEIWVVDNSSLDETLTKACKFKELHALNNLKIFQNLENVSLGGSLKVIFKKAEVSNFTHVVIIHGDNQASPSDLRSVFESLTTANQSESFFGSRFMRGAKLSGYRRERIVGNLVLNLFYSVRCGTLLSDLGSGLNIYSVQQLRKIDYADFGNSLAFNYQLILDFVLKKQKFNFFPIHWEEIDQISNAKNFDVFVRGLKILLSRTLPFVKVPGDFMPDFPEEIEFKSC